MRTMTPLKIIRLSPSILILKLVFLEIMLILFHLLATTLFSQIFTTASSTLFILFSILEMLTTGIIIARWMSEIYFIYNDFILHRVGIFHIKEEEYSLRSIEALTVNQSFLGRIFNFGTLQFFSPVLRQEYYLINIPDAFKIRDLVESVVHEAKASGGKEKIIFRR